MSDSIQVFISHRHVDKPVADVFRRALVDWSNGRIEVYQSSNAETASRISEDLDGAIAAAIARSSVMLLIFTEAPGDMDWCMYECGLSQDPQSPTTRVAVFHTTPEPPDPLDGLICMRLNPESLTQFAYGIHHDADFFPGADTPIAPNADDELVEQRADELFRALRAAAPNAVEETVVYDRLTLGLPLETVEAIRKQAEGVRLRDLYDQVDPLLAEQLVIRSTNGEPQEHFNFNAIEENARFSDLVKRWQTDSNYGEGNHWAEGLYDAITRAILRRPEREVAFPFDSLDSDGRNWLLPILSRYRTLPHLGQMEFEVLFCRLNREAAMRMLPEPE